jgi:hypothetical protein
VLNQEVIETSIDLQRLRGGNKKWFILAVVEMLCFFVLLAICHELGHIAVYQLTHSDPHFYLMWGQEGYWYVIYPDGVDEFTMLVTWGGFLGTVPFIPFYRRINKMGQLLLLVMVIYGFLEGVNGMIGRVLDPLVFTIMALVPAWIDMILWIRGNR